MLVDASGTTYDTKTYNNIKATASTGKTPQTWTFDSQVLLSSTDGTLYGYYPYNSSVTDLTKVPVSAGETDYMYATPAEGLNDGSYNANVTMNHALAAIRLKIVRGTYTAAGSVTNLAIKSDNIATSATLNAKTGTLTSPTGAGTAINKTVTQTLSSSAQTTDFIFVPVTGSSAQPTFTATIDGKDYVATAGATSFAQGNLYEYTLTIDAKAITLSDVKVGDWSYNQSGNPVIQAGYKVTIAGNTEGIAFSNKVNDDGSVTIIAVPNYVLPVLKVLAEAECSTGATCTQIVNELGGRTITLSNITSDITLSFDNKLVDKNGVYAVSSTGSLIDYNSADATALGVALVAGEHKFIITKSDATDGTNTTFSWGKSLQGKDVAGVVTNGKVDGTNSSGYLPKSDGTFSGTPNLSADFNTWTAGALSDFNGAANTAAIIAGYTEHGVSMGATDMCSVLGTFNASDSHNDWYIPACGQLALIYLNMTEINAALEKIGGTALAAKDYWSSSEGSSAGALRVYFYNGYIDNRLKSSGSYRVRFVRDI